MFGFWMMFGFWIPLSGFRIAKLLKGSRILDYLTWGDNERYATGFYRFPKAKTDIEGKEGNYLDEAMLSVQQVCTSISKTH